MYGAIDTKLGGAIVSEATIRLHIEPLDEGGFVATSPDVPGLVAEGRSLVEVAEIARDVARAIAESCREHGDPLPPALTTFDGSKPFELTIPVGVG
jgi:antitoxin HicB